MLLRPSRDYPVANGTSIFRWLNRDFNSHIWHIRLCQVSKWFRAITYEDVLWRSLYIYAPFPRPPGPSPSQSRAFLERMLVKSAQLAQSWTTRPMREVSSVGIKLGVPLPCTHVKLINGRWLVGCEEYRRFVLHDIDPSSKTRVRQVLWEQEQPVCAWDVHSMSPVEGQSVVYVLLQFFRMYQGSPDWHWYVSIWLRISLFGKDLYLSLIFLQDAVRVSAE